ncbi:hypothetical protein LguiA_005010 [Lonicera macranthoides]
MFLLTFLLLIYAKFFRRTSSNRGVAHNSGRLTRSASRFSGIDKTVVESLPFFRFSSLKGTRQGLECAVCLSKFEDVEVLRLLPKCKHAFHIACVDQWLENHSSCPLCRHRISIDDTIFFTNSSSLRFSRTNSEIKDDSNLELFIQREEENCGSSRFSCGGSFSGRFNKAKKEEEMPIEDSSSTNENEQGDDEEILHKDVVLKNRWSSVSSSDLMFLNSNMLNEISSNRFPPSHSNNAKFPSTSSTSEFEPSKVLNHSEKRSISEITTHPRFKELNEKSSSGECSMDESNVKEEIMRSVWLPIAQKTVQWFANRERRDSQSHNTRESLNV